MHIVCACAIVCPSAACGAKLSGLSRCGPIAMQICASACGFPITGEQVDKHIEGDAEGCTLFELQRVGNLLGLRSLAVQYPNGLPVEGAAPAVLPTINAEGRQHFIALVGCRDGHALVVDLPSRPRWVTEQDLRTALRWHGEALHFAADDSAIAMLTTDIETRRAVPREAALLSSSVVLAIAALAITVANRWRPPGQRTQRGGDMMKVAISE